VGTAAIQQTAALSRDVIFVEIARLLERFRAADASITAETVIAEDLTMDSLQVMDLMMELEDRFDVSIPLNLVPEIATVGQLADTIYASKAAA
jgi:acyl carrier protein